MLLLWWSLTTHSSRHQNYPDLQIEWKETTGSKVHTRQSGGIIIITVVIITLTPHQAELHTPPDTIGLCNL